MKGVAVAIIAILIVAALVFGVVPQLAQFTPPDTTGHSFYIKGLAGNSIQSGANADQFDSPDYVTSFTAAGMSEKIVLMPQIYYYGFPVGDGPAGVTMAYYWWKITFEGTGPFTVDWYGARSTGTTYTTQQFPTPSVLPIGLQWVSMQASIFKLVGPCTGKMHIELWAHHTWIDIVWGFPKIRAADDVFAIDEALLQSGLGKVTVPTYTEEGTDMALTVTAESSHSDTQGGDGPGGWALILFNNKGAQKQSWDIPDGSSGYTVKYPVPIGAFDSTPGTNNNWKVELWNNLFRTHQEYTVVIKQGSVAIMPPPPTITSDMGRPPYPAGSTLTWLVTGTANPNGYGLSGFRVSVQFETSAGQLGEFIIENQLYAASANPDKTNWYATVQLTAPQIGKYVISAQSIDTQNNPSVFGKLEFETGPPGVEPPPPPSEFNWLIIVAVAAILIAIVVAILLIRRFFPYGVLVGAILLGGAAAGIWYVWTVML